jgi:predicted Rdx family selenoprotein
MPEYSITEFNQLCQLLNVTWIGNLISKDAAERLRKGGMVNSTQGFYYITVQGINTLVSLGVLRPDVTYKMNEDTNK